MTDEHEMIFTGVVFFAAGLIVGAAAGVLLTPHSGPRTRRRLAHLAENVYEDVKERASGLAEETSDTVQRMVNRGRRTTMGG